MTELIACLSSGKGTWEHVAKLINAHDWEKVYLLTDDFGMSHFKKTDTVELIQINPNLYLTELIEDVYIKLKSKIKHTDIALNMISGSGKEHMAVLSALLKLGVGIRLVTITPQGLREV